MPVGPVLKRVHLRNLLSFGADAEPVELGPLNVLIGPNGSGKTNFIEAMGLLHELPGEFTEPVREGGGARNWIWKGESPYGAIASVDVDVSFGEWARAETIRYELEMSLEKDRLVVSTEEVASWSGRQSERVRLLTYAAWDHKLTVRTGKSAKNTKSQEKTYEDLDLDNQRSILAQSAEGHVPSDVYPLIRYFKGIRLYRDWRMGRDAPARFPQPADLRNDFLEESGRNLGHILNHLRSRAKLKKSLLENLRRLLPDAQDIDILVQGGTLQIYIQEESFEDAIPATRLSDGTLRWLSLLAILLHPTPFPLVCLEEPEVGLHPDMMHVLAELLRDASQRMQLIVTTHSEALVDALSSTPEAVIVCEREQGSTRMRRLDKEKLAIWLEEYSLGHLWRSGQIGGNRW